MIKEILKITFSKNKVLELILWAIAFFVIYTVVDYLNMTYLEMTSTFGWYLVVVNIFINILMAFIGSLMFIMTSINFKLTSKNIKLSNASFIAVLFGILTYGCTTCVIAFFAAIGINLIVISLPLAGLPYKLVALLFLLITFVIVINSLNRNMCKLK